MVRHIVLFSISEEAGGARESLLQSLAALPDRIDEIEAFALGPLLNDGAHDYALTVDVADEPALEAYRDHPEHRPVVEQLRTSATDIVVADIAV